MSSGFSLNAPITCGLFPKNIYLFLSVYLAARGLSCSTRDLWCSLQSVETLVPACGILFPDQELNPGSLHWELRVLAAGPPQKSHLWTLKNMVWHCLLKFSFNRWGNWAQISAFFLSNRDEIDSWSDLSKGDMGLRQWPALHKDTISTNLPTPHVHGWVHA